MRVFWRVPSNNKYSEYVMERERECVQAHVRVCVCVCTRERERRTNKFVPIVGLEYRQAAFISPNRNQKKLKLKQER